jgi:hypothetical protein
VPALPVRLPAYLAFALGLVLAALAQPAAVRAEVQEEILQQTATLRGLEAKAPVPFAFAEVEKLRADLLQSYNNQNTVNELETSRKLLVMLGLLSPDADLHGMLVDLYAENILGYYNSEDKRMYVVSGTSAFDPQAKMTLAHEFTHALQDQHFDLTRVQKLAEENGDRSLAISALIEGDATLAMIQYARDYLTPEELIQIQTQSSRSSLDQAPLVIRDELSFPYNEGALFAIQLWGEGGWAAVNRAFNNPPNSTEQILHPEKYLRNEQPIPVKLDGLAAALGPDWRQLRSDVLGELDVRILLQQFSDPAAAERGADGWGGDRFSLLQNAAGENALAISTVWDDEAQAAEFFNAYIETVQRRYGGRARKTVDLPAKLVWTVPNGALLLEKSGAGVVLLMGPNEALLNSLLAAVRSEPLVPAPAPSPQPARPAPVQVPS